MVRTRGGSEGKSNRKVGQAWRSLLDKFPCSLRIPSMFVMDTLSVMFKVTDEGVRYQHGNTVGQAWCSLVDRSSSQKPLRKQDWNHKCWIGVVPLSPIVW